MKRTRFMTRLITFALVICLIASMSVLTAFAQDAPDQSAYSYVEMNYEEKEYTICHVCGTEFDTTDGMDDFLAHDEQHVLASEGSGYHSEVREISTPKTVVVPQAHNGSAFSDTKTTYVITLYWDDNNNANGTRPEEVNAVLTANGGEFGSEYIHLNESNHWENVRSLLPMYYYKGSRSGVINYAYELLDLPQNYTVSVEQTGNWLKVTCSLKQTHLIGDADGNNDISIDDATVIARYDAGMKVSSYDPIASDTNGDGSTDIIDATVIQRFLIGLNCSRYDIGKEI